MMARLPLNNIWSVKVNTEIMLQTRCQSDKNAKDFEFSQCLSSGLIRQGLSLETGSHKGSHHRRQGKTNGGEDRRTAQNRLVWAAP